MSTPTDNPSEIIYPNNSAVHSLDLATGKDSVVADLDFEPRCVQATSNVLAAGGVYDARESRVATGPQKGLFAIRNIHTGETYARDLGSFINNAVSLYESGSELKAVVCNNDHSLYFLDIGSDRFAVTETIRLAAPLNHASVSPDRKTVIACGDTPQVAIIHPDEPDHSSWKVSQTFDSGSDLGFSVAFHPAGNMFGVAFQDGTARIYDIRMAGSSKPITEIKSSRPVELNGAFRCMKFSSGPEDLVFLSEQMHRVHAVDLRDFNNHQVLTIPQDFGQQPQEEEEAIEPIIQSYDEVIDTASTHNDHNNNNASGGGSPQPLPLNSRNHHRRVYADHHSFLQMPASRYLRYGQNDDGISGLTWSEFGGGSVIVGTDTGIGVWKIDGWSRRTFPAYSIR